MFGRLILTLGRPSSHGWSGPVRRPARAWESVILPAMVKEKLLHDVEEFISADEKAWYASKGMLPSPIVTDNRNPASSRVNDEPNVRVSLY